MLLNLKDLSDRTNSHTTEKYMNEPYEGKECVMNLSSINLEERTLDCYRIPQTNMNVILIDNIRVFIEISYPGFFVVLFFTIS